MASEPNLSLLFASGPSDCGVLRWSGSFATLLVLPYPTFASSLRASYMPLLPIATSLQVEFEGTGCFRVPSCASSCSAPGYATDRRLRIPAWEDDRTSDSLYNLVLTWVSTTAGA